MADLFRNIIDCNIDEAESVSAKAVLFRLLPQLTGLSNSHDARDIGFAFVRIRCRLDTFCRWIARLSERHRFFSDDHCLGVQGINT